MTHKKFGVTPEGEFVRVYTIKSDKITVKILNFGAILQSLTVDGELIPTGEHPSVCGTPSALKRKASPIICALAAGRFAHTSFTKP